MKIELPKEINDIDVTNGFECPEGNFVGTVFHIKEHPFKKGTQTVPGIRVLFEVQVPGHPLCYYAGKTVEASLAGNSSLKVMLVRWFGSSFAEVLGQKDQFDFDCLIGRKGEVTVKHFQNPGHSKPYSAVMGVYPLGELELTEHVCGPRCSCKINGTCCCCGGKKQGEVSHAK